MRPLNRARPLPSRHGRHAQTARYARNRWTSTSLTRVSVIRYATSLSCLPMSLIRPARGRSLLVAGWHIRGACRLSVGRLLTNHLGCGQLRRSPSRTTLRCSRGPTVLSRCSTPQASEHASSFATWPGAALPATMLAASLAPIACASCLAVEVHIRAVRRRLPDQSVRLPEPALHGPTSSGVRWPPSAPAAMRATGRAEPGFDDARQTAMVGAQ